VSEPTSSQASGEASRLLLAWGAGDATALDRLMPIVYRELRYLARRKMRGERPGHSLQTADLVNEAYLRLVHQQNAGWRHRAQFFAVAATLMRRILVDRARRHRYQKRGGPAIHVTLDDEAIASPARPEELMALDAALQRLEQHDSRKSAVVELRYFGGLTTEEIAEHLGVAPITVKRDWSLAKAWLHREMAHAKVSFP
jgi:RNA polymerase sigma factor (TIGR02999 family)